MAHSGQCDHGHVAAAGGGVCGRILWASRRAPPRRRGRRRSTGLAIFLGIIAVAILSVLILSRIDTNREGGRRAANGIQREPSGAGS